MKSSTVDFFMFWKIWKSAEESVGSLLKIIVKAPYRKLWHRGQFWFDTREQCFFSTFSSAQDVWLHVNSNILKYRLHVKHPDVARGEAITAHLHLKFNHNPGELTVIPFHSPVSVALPCKWLKVIHCYSSRITQFPNMEQDFRGGHQTIDDFGSVPFECVAVGTCVYMPGAALTACMSVILSFQHCSLREHSSFSWNELTVTSG